MKYLLVLIVVILLLSCSNRIENENETDLLLTDSLQTEAIDNSEEFLKHFKNIEPKNLHIYTIERDKEGVIISSSFIGIAIDIKKFSFLNDENIFINIQACKEGNSNIYAIGKFEINDKFIGLIMRQYSQYDETIIQLMLWDKIQKKIVYAIDLADSFGDEGWYFDKESWIKEFEFNKKLVIVSRQKDCNPEDEEFTSFSYTDSLKVSNFDGRIFTTKDLNAKDTIHYKLKLWN